MRAVIRQTSRPFAKDQVRLRYLAEVAKRNSCRVSELLELTGAGAYFIDCRAAEATEPEQAGNFDESGDVIEW
jgi:hypothetical protein